MLKWVVAGVALDGCGMALLAPAWPRLGALGLLGPYALVIYAVHGCALPWLFLQRPMPARDLFGFGIIYVMLVLMFAPFLGMLCGFTLEVVGLVAFNILASVWFTPDVAPFDAALLLALPGGFSVGGLMAGIALHAFRPDRDLGRLDTPWRARSDILGGVIAALAWLMYFVLGRTDWSGLPFQTDWSGVLFHSEPGTIPAQVFGMGVAALIPHLVLSARNASRNVTLSAVRSGMEGSPTGAARPET